MLGVQDGREHLAFVRSSDCSCASEAAALVFGVIAAHDYARPKTTEFTEA